MAITLSPRLAQIASYVLPGASVIDVGTDHAYLPIWLLQTGRSELSFASDCRYGPLQRAAADAAQAGVSDRLTLYLCDGLAQCAPESVDTIIMAGMGGETMMRIIEDAPWASEKRLIVQPQSKLPELRRFLASLGLAVIDASLVYDTGRIYLVWLVGAGQWDGEDIIDPVLLDKRDPLLLAWTEEQLKRGRKILRGLQSAASPDMDAIQARKRALETLERIRKEALSWRS